MNIPGQERIVVFFLLSFSTTCLSLAEDSPEPQLPQQINTVSQKKKSEQGNAARIKGIVRYEADSKRPWRYARYYVSGQKKGTLAEAVVCLDGKPLGLQKWKKQPAQIEMDQKDYLFIPETVAIQAGDSILFRNSDKAIHNVQTFHKQHAFNINMPPNGSHKEIFRHAGGIKTPYVIGCVFHSAMRAWIFVFDHPYFVITAKKGSYDFQNVPPGTYQLEIRHPAGELQWSKQVELKRGETITLDVSLSPDHKAK